MGKGSFQLYKDGASGWQEGSHSSLMMHRASIPHPCPHYYLFKSPCLPDHSPILPAAHVCTCFGISTGVGTESTGSHLYKNESVFHEHTKQNENWEARERVYELRLNNYSMVVCL